MTTPDIIWVGMTREHYQAGRSQAIRALVVHSTAGSFPGDLKWLRKGGDEKRPVSCHYYIDKTGVISQLVRDEDTAWHAGISRWPIDGQEVSGLNACSLGIELENRNDGRDPYPAAQVASLIALSRLLVTRYAIPRSQFVRHLEISPGRKTDPAGLDWAAAVAQVYPPSTGEPYTEHSPILGPTRATPAQALAYILARRHGAYTRFDFAGAILPAYFTQAAAGIPAELLLAQAIHETGNFSSALSQRQDRDGRPLRNPAGIGVTGASSATPRPGYVWDADRQCYRACCQFKDWAGESVPAHVGRLLAYALPLEAELTPEQAVLIAYALHVRPFPDAFRGSAATLRALGKAHNPKGAQGAGWASPGTDYGAKIARIANAICEVSA